MDRPGDIDVLLLGAVPLEIRALIEALQDCQAIASRDQTIWCGKHANLAVLIGTTGLGKVNAAITTTALLERFPVRQVWHFGCAGAYAEGPLGIGDVLITEKVLCGDEGVLTRGAVMSLRQIGIPILLRHGKEYFDQVPLLGSGVTKTLIENTPPGVYRQSTEFPLSPARFCEAPDLAVLGSLAKSNRGAYPVEHPLPSSQCGEGPGPACFHLVHGPSLTVGMASGDPHVAGERFRRHGAYAENMEGSAVAHACCRFEIPMLECRGISNFAGTRAKESWEFEKSIAHSHGIIIKWLDALNSMKSSL